jgi:Ca2+-binding RTX toxin-like protein
VQTIVRPESGLLSLEDGLAWSPDGSRLAVGGGAIFDRAGHLVGRYAPASSMQAVSHAPKWSLDGTTIVFERAAAQYYSWRYGSGLVLGNADLYAAAALGEETTRLTATPDFDETGVVFRPARGGGTAGTAQECAYEGTAARDVVYGTWGDDLISAGPGNDVVLGRGGNDLIVGGNGDDVLRGGPGHDEIRGDAGRDRLFARDRMWDNVFGGPGRDRAWVDRRRDSVTGVETVYRRR